MSSRVTNVNVQSQPFHLQSCLDPRFSVEMVQSLIKDMCKRLSKSQQCIVFIGILASLNFWPEKSFLHKYICVYKYVSKQPLIHTLSWSAFYMTFEGSLRQVMYFT
jgi:hypothetical protein